MDWFSLQFVVIEVLQDISLRGLDSYIHLHYCPVNDSLTGGNRLF